MGVFVNSNYDRWEQHGVCEACGREQGRLSPLPPTAPTTAAVAN